MRQSMGKISVFISTVPIAHCIHSMFDERFSPTPGLFPGKFAWWGSLMFCVVLAQQSRGVRYIGFKQHVYDIVPTSQSIAAIDDCTDPILLCSKNMGMRGLGSCVPGNKKRREQQRRLL